MLISRVGRELGTSESVLSTHCVNYTLSRNAESRQAADWLLKRHQQAEWCSDLPPPHPPTLICPRFAFPVSGTSSEPNTSGGPPSPDLTEDWPDEEVVLSNFPTSEASTECSNGSDISAVVPDDTGGVAEEEERPEKMFMALPPFFLSSLKKLFEVAADEGRSTSEVWCFLEEEEERQINAELAKIKKCRADNF